jgi:hypothetical protein
MAEFDPKQITDLLKKANISGAEDIAASFEKLGASSEEVGKLVKSLVELEEQKKELARTDVASAVAIEKHKALMIKQAKATAELAAKEKELAKALEDGKQLTEEQTIAFKKLQKAEADAKHETGEIKKEIVAYQEATMKAFKTNTLLGRGFSLLESPLMRFAGGLTAGSLALKALGKFQDAARLRNELMVKSFQGLDTSSFWGAIKETKRLDDALSGVQATAARFGVDTAEAGRLMSSYADVAGTKNPEALAKWSKATIMVAKSMNIDQAQAVEFVSNRIQKYGGTVDSALMELNELRVDTEKSNKAFTEQTRKISGVNKELEVTVLKADDLASVLTGLSRESSIYALNQRFVSGTLRDTTLKLQAQGETYQFAKDAAKDYVEALTTKAPEWMKIISGEKMLASMQSAYGKGGETGSAAFMKKFGADLDKARPGLSKKVMAILDDKSMSSYTKNRLVQQLTQGTEVGMKAMNDQLLGFYESTGGDITAIAQQMFGGDFVKAEAAVKAAQEMKRTQDIAIKANQMSAAELAKTFKLGGAENDKDGLKRAEGIRKIAAQYKISSEEQKSLDIENSNNKEELLGKMSAAEKQAHENNLKSIQAKEKGLKTALDNENKVATKMEFQATQKEAIARAENRRKEIAQETLEIDKKIGDINTALSQEKGDTKASEEKIKELKAQKEVYEEAKESLGKELESTKTKVEMDVTKKTPLDNVMKDLNERQGNTALLTLDYIKEVTSGITFTNVLLGSIAALLLKMSGIGPMLLQKFAGSSIGQKGIIGGAKDLWSRMRGRGPSGGGESGGTPPTGGSDYDGGGLMGTAPSKVLGAEKAATKGGGIFSKLKGGKLGKFGKAAGLLALAGGGAFLASSLFGKSAMASEGPMGEGGGGEAPPEPPKSKGGFLSGLSGMVPGFLKSEEGLGTAGMALTGVSGLAKGVLGKSLGGIGKVLSMGAALPSAYATYQSKGLMGAAAELAPSALGAVGGMVGGALGTMVAPGIGTMAIGAGGSMAGEAIGNQLASWMKGTSPDTAKALQPVAAAPAPTPAPISTGASGEPSMAIASPVQSDGSVMVKIMNFMDAHASAQSMAMAKGIRS